MNVPNNLKPVFAHWRVIYSDISNNGIPQDGPPPQNLLVRYSRRDGFVFSSWGNEKVDRAVSRERGKVNIRPHHNGGATLCQLYDEETGELVSRGQSVCSLSDPFNYKLGRQIALGRALANLE